MEVVGMDGKIPAGRFLGAVLHDIEREYNFGLEFVGLGRTTFGFFLFLCYLCKRRDQSIR